MVAEWVEIANRSLNQPSKRRKNQPETDGTLQKKPSVFLVMSSKIVGGDKELSP